MRKILLGFVVDVAKTFLCSTAAQAGINVAFRVVPLPSDPEPVPVEPPKRRRARKQ